MVATISDGEKGVIDPCFGFKTATYGLFCEGKEQFKCYNYDFTVKIDCFWHWFVDFDYSKNELIILRLFQIRTACEWRCALMGAHSLSPCILIGPVVGLRESAWKG